MATFFRPSALWRIDFRFDGRDRRWFKSFRTDVDVKVEATHLLRDLHGQRAQLVEVRLASEEEETQYVRGEETKNSFCPTGR